MDGRVQRGQERVIQHFQNFPLCPRSAFLVPPRQVLLLHHLRREHGTATFFFGLRQIDGTHVAGAEAAREAEVREGERPRTVDERGAGVGGWRVRLGVREWRVEEVRGGGGRDGGCFGAETCAAFGGVGGSEAETVKVVG